MAWFGKSSLCGFGMDRTLPYGFGMDRTPTVALERLDSGLDGMEPLVRGTASEPSESFPKSSTSFFKGSKQ
jgi:hypothetical protein